MTFDEWKDKEILSGRKITVEACHLLRKAYEAGENNSYDSRISDIQEAFISRSSGDDFEMAEAAREIMEILDISCYRHGKVKSGLTRAKEIIKACIEVMESHDCEYTDAYKQAEEFIKETE